MTTQTLPGAELYQQWLEKTADPAQIEQRIKELKIIRFWLEQNMTMVDSSISALDLQAKTIALVKENPFLNGIDPMQAIMNPMQIWMDGMTKMAEAMKIKAP